LTKNVNGDVALFPETKVIEGTGQMVVVTVGMNSQIGTMINALNEVTAEWKERNERENK
jgi:magnesium-transporting ATPase (P-type)